MVPLRQSHSQPRSHLLVFDGTAEIGLQFLIELLEVFVLPP
jgi:hypothetical protein